MKYFKIKILSALLAIPMVLGTNNTTWALANNNSISVQEQFQTIKNTASDITNLNNNKINIDGFTVETKLIVQKKIEVHKMTILDLQLQEIVSAFLKLTIMLQLIVMVEEF